jgi:hypothetical protein
LVVTCSFSAPSISIFVSLQPGLILSTSHLLGLNFILANQKNFWFCVKWFTITSAGSRDKRPAGRPTSGHMPMEIIHHQRKMGSIDQQLLAGVS